jgi:hypothetical protein
MLAMLNDMMSRFSMEQHFDVPLSAGTLDVNASAAMANKHRIAMIS